MKKPANISVPNRSSLVLALQQALFPSASIAASSLLALSLAGASISTQAQTLELSDLDGSNGFVLNGIDFDDNSGRSVSGVGDVNGDGINDLLIGAYFADPNGDNSGESYLVFGRSNGFTNPFELSALDGTNGVVINGIDVGGWSGRSVSGVGDVNGDGLADLLIGALFADANGNGDSGESYLLFGRSDSFTSPLELSTLDGSNGVVINGIDAGDLSGYSVSGAGDINGDSLADLLIGAPLASPNGDNSGESYLVFGRSNGFTSPLDLSTLDGANGVVLNGIDANDFSGRSVSGVGDVNDDGVDDVLIGANDADPNGDSSGESYLVFGRSNGFTSPFELSTLDGANGVVLNGIDADDESGDAVSGAGDVNGDGINDLLIGAHRADPNGDSSGESYLLFGRSDSFTSPLELSALDGANGVVINGIDANDESGYSVSGAGDINGDGVDDLLIGADNANPNGDFSGETYLLFGRSDGFTSPLELSALDGSNGLVLNGIDASDSSGRAVSGLGDVNGDGGNDFIIGAPGADPNGAETGESYVVFVTIPDTTPELFRFIDVPNALLASEQTSDPITITGINLPTPISITGGTYEINNSGAFTAVPGTVKNNDTVRVRHTAAATFSTFTETILTIGGVVDVFSSITITEPTAEPIFEDQFED